MNPELEKEFTATSNILLGIPLQGLDVHRLWLARRVPLPKKTISAASGKDVWIPPSRNYMGKELNPGNAVSWDEFDKVSRSHFQPEDLGSAKVKEIIRIFLRPVLFHCGNVRYQANENVDACSGAGGGRNIYQCEDVYMGVKNIAFSNFTLWSQNAFGCDAVTNSSFVIHAYSSDRLARCFEVDGCASSSGLLFCHNCENVHDSMFCFNARNLRYAIGNVQVPVDRYNELRASVLREIDAELERSKSLRWDIFSIGSRREGLWYRKLMTR